MYDPGFPFLRPLLYGLGGVVFVAAAFAIGFAIARPGAPQTVTVEERFATVADRAADEVLVVRAAPERESFPAFAPEGVIVVHAPSAPERTFAAATTTGERRPETARRRPRLYERRAPAVVAREDPSPETIAEEPRRRPARNEASPAREVEEAEYAEAQAEEPDTRSWYGSEEYRREVAERRRARRRGQ